MKLLILYSLLIAALPLAFPQNLTALNSLPDCGKFCITSVLPKIKDCSPTNYQCLCADQDFYNGMQNCTIEYCPTVGVSPEEENHIINIAFEICEGTNTYVDGEYRPEDWASTSTTTTIAATETVTPLVILTTTLPYLGEGVSVYTTTDIDTITTTTPTTTVTATPDDPGFASNVASAVSEHSSVWNSYAAQPTSEDWW